MLRAPLRYVAAFLLGSAVGWVGSRRNDVSLVSNESISTAKSAQPGVVSSAQEPTRSVAQVLELARPGGGLQRDAELFDALKAMRAEDFRAAVSLWTIQLQARLQGDEVRGWAILDRWFELDPESAKSFAESVCGQTPSRQSSEAMRFGKMLAASAARNDPEWALGHLLVDRPNPPWANPNTDLMAEVVEKNPALAKEWLQRMEKSNLRNARLTGYVTGAARNDPLAAMDLAVAEKGFERVNLIPYCARAAASKGRGVALEALTKIEDPSLRRKTAFAAMQVLARETNTPPFLFLEEAVGRDNLAAIEIDSISQSDAVAADPPGAANWAADLPDKSRQVFLNWILESWQRIDSKAAMEWLQQRSGTSSGREENSVTALANAMLANRLITEGRTTEAIAALSQTTDVGMTFGMVSFKIARDDPEAAAQCAVSMPEGEARERVAADAAETWILRDPAAAARWVEHLPAGTMRNRALDGMIDGIIEIDPEGASRWATLITEPILRRADIERIFGQWSRRDAAAAREWVRNVPNVDEVWRTKLLRRNP
jgi:hypothetical protein